MQVRSRTQPKSIRRIMNKRKALNLTYGLLLIIAAAAMLLDACNVHFFIGLIDRWYLVLLAFFSAAFLANSVIMKRHGFIVLAASTLGIFLSLSVMTADFTYAQSWYLIPIFVGFGLVIFNAFANRSAFLFAIGSGIMAFFIALMVSYIYGVWRYVLPCEIIVYAIAFIVWNFTRRKAHDKDEEVYYVVPSDEE